MLLEGSRLSQRQDSSPTIAGGQRCNTMVVPSKYGQIPQGVIYLRRVVKGMRSSLIVSANTYHTHQIILQTNA